MYADFFTWDEVVIILILPILLLLSCLLISLLQIIKCFSESEKQTLRTGSSLIWVHIVCIIHNKSTYYSADEQAEDCLTIVMKGKKKFKVIF